MGLPEILIEFKTKAQTAVTRSQNGIVAVILKFSSPTLVESSRINQSRR